MARLAPLGITLLLLLATCFFGFETWNKAQGLKDQVTTINSQMAAQTHELTKSKADLKTAQDSLATSKSDLDKAKADLATAQGTLDAANAQVATLTEQVKTANAAVAEAKSKGAAPPPPPPGPSSADLDAVNAKLKDATAHLAELTQLNETLTNKAKDAESRVDDLQKTVRHYESNVLRNGLEGEVLAVNQGWGFVVLSIGDRQGAIANGEMILTRGDSQIGKVRITSVEPSTSVADIIPGSLSRGVRVQPGDRVIFQGN